jgi:hypothetical protein
MYSPTEPEARGTGAAPHIAAIACKGGGTFHSGMTCVGLVLEALAFDTFTLNLSVQEWFAETSWTCNCLSVFARMLGPAGAAVSSVRSSLYLV